MQPLLSVKDLTIGFKKDDPVVRSVDFSLAAGETLALVGESGSGKTLCCRSILRLLPPTASIRSGSITLNCRDESLELMDLNEKSIAKIRGDRVAMVFQEPMRSLSPLHRIGDQVSEVLCLHRGCNVSSAKVQVLEAFADVGFVDPERAYKSYPFELSGGMLQRAGIAMATVARPDLLIADEPTTALDMTTQAQVLGLLKSMQKKIDTALILVTHDLGVVANMADKVVVMHRGEVMEAGTANQVLGSPSHAYTKLLFGAAAEIPDTFAEASAAQSINEDNILELHNVNKTFTTSARVPWKKPTVVAAAREINLSLTRGKTLAIVGESGSGKSTLARIALGAETPDAGGAVLFRESQGDSAIDVHKLDDAGKSAFRNKAQMVFQDPHSSLSPRMQIIDALTEPLEIHNVGTRSERHDIAVELLKKVGLDPAMLRRYPHAFSGGQRQRVSIARALALNPTLLVLDEPTSALDVSVQAQILELLEDIRENMQLSYLFISHDLAVVARIADHIAVMRRGYIVEQASTESLLSAPKHPYTKALLAAHPEPDINRRIDLEMVANGAGEPDTWAEEYRLNNNNLPPLVKLSDQHWVRANQ